MRFNCKAEMRNLYCLSLLALSVSSQRASAQSGVSVRDSAGVSIVEVSAAFLSALPVWRIAPNPKVSIGSVDGDEAYLFDGIKRTAIARLTNGSLAIADGSSSIRGSAEIRIFDSTGRFVRRIGRKGQGPGEFSAPPDIRAGPQGGVIASDRTRVTRFDASGKMLDSWQVPINPCPERCSDRGLLGNGSYAVFSDNVPLSGRGATPGATVDGLKAYYGLATRDSTRIVATINLPPRKVAVRPEQQVGGRLTLNQMAMVRSADLSPSPESGVIAGQDHFAVTLHNPFEFRIYNASAKLIRIIRVNRPPVRVTDAEKRAIIAASDAQLRIEGRVVADFWPQFDYVRFGDNDDLWVQDYYRTTRNESGPVWFTIFGSNGIPVARLDARSNPLYRDQSRSVVHQAPSGRDVYRTITTDSLGVQRLLVFGIIK